MTAQEGFAFGIPAILLFILTVNHVSRRWTLLSVVVPAPLRFLIVARETLILVALQAAMAILVPLIAGFRSLEELVVLLCVGVSIGVSLAPLAGVPLRLTDRGGPLRPQRYRHYSGQILFERAFEHAVAQGWVEASAGGELENDAPRRAALIARYLDEAVPGQWITLTKEQARLHEDYYRQSAIGRFLWFLIVGSFVGSVLVGLQLKYPTIELFKMMQYGSFYIFGAVILDANLLPIVGGFIVFACIFSSLPASRFVVSLFVVLYIGLSIEAMPRVSAALQREPMVVSLYALEDRARQVQRRAREAAQIPLLGPLMANITRRSVPPEVFASADVAQIIRQITNLSPRALIGFSLVNWLLLGGLVLRHLWLTEAGNVFFAHKMRRPLVFGAPTSLSSSIASREKPVGMDSLPAP